MKLGFGARRVVHRPLRNTPMSNVLAIPGIRLAPRDPTLLTEAGLTKTSIFKQYCSALKRYRAGEISAVELSSLMNSRNVIGEVPERMNRAALKPWDVKYQS